MANQREYRRELRSLSDAFLYDTYIKACLSVKRGIDMSRNGRKSMEHFVNEAENEMTRRGWKDKRPPHRVRAGRE